MSAKLARLEQQEAEFMAKYGKKSQAASATAQSDVEDLRKDVISARELNDKAAENPELGIKIKKKKKRQRDRDTEEVVPEAEEDVMCVQRIPSDKTKKMKKNNTEKEEESLSSPADTFGTLVETTDFVNNNKKKKKRKSLKLACDDVPQQEVGETKSNQAEPTQDCPPEGKRKKARVLIVPADVGEQRVTVKQKRKKCKKDKVRVEGNEEEAPPKKKKKRKSKE